MPLHQDVTQRLRDSVRTYRLFSASGYFTYSFVRLRSFPLRETTSRIMEFLRPWRLLTLILRIIARLITWLETGTLLLLTLLAMSLMLPLLLLCGLLMPIVAAIQNRRCSARIRAVIDGSPGAPICVCFAGPDALEPDSYFSGMVRDLAARGSTVLVVPSGLQRRRSPLRPGAAMHRETPNLYLVRGRLYFYLRRRLLPRHPARVILIY